MLVGYDSVKAYLFRMGREPTDRCMYCGEVDTYTFRLQQVKEFWTTAKLPIGERLSTIRRPHDQIQGGMRCGRKDAYEHHEK